MVLLCDHGGGGLVLWTQATARATVHRQLDASGGSERLNIPQTLPDGVMVTAGEETRTTVATWTVLVTIDRPALLPQFRKRLENLETLVPPQWTEPTLVPFRALWREQINQIRETWMLPMQSEVSRRNGITGFCGGGVQQTVLHGYPGPGYRVTGSRGGPSSTGHARGSCVWGAGLPS